MPRIQGGGETGTALDYERVCMYLDEADDHEAPTPGGHGEGQRGLEVCVRRSAGMHAWMDGRMDGRTDGWTTDDSMDVWI